MSIHLRPNEPVNGTGYRGHIARVQSGDVDPPVLGQIDVIPVYQRPALGFGELQVPMEV